jgi:hypothetical protein
MNKVALWCTETGSRDIEHGCNEITCEIEFGRAG